MSVAVVAELAALLGLQVDKKGFNEARRLIGGIRSALGGLVAAAGVKSLTGFIEHTAEGATHLVAFSKAMGLTVEQTQEWGYVAEQSGSNLRELSVGFGMAERNLRNFAEGRGGKALRATMREIGTSTEDAKAALASPDGMNAWLLKTSQRFKELGDNAQRGALGQAVFGARAGRAVVADMARGADAIKELMERRRSMGELSGEQATQMRDLSNRIRDVKTSVGALGAQVVASLAPALIDMATAATKWIAANKDIISGAFEIALRGVAAVFGLIGDIIGGLAKLIRDAFGGDAGAIAILTGIAAVITAVVAPAIGAMVIAIGGVVAALAPIGIIVGGIAYGIVQLIKHWDDVNAALHRAIDWAKHEIVDLGDTLGNALERALDYLANLPVVKQLREIVEAIGGFSPTKDEKEFAGSVGIRDQRGMDEYNATQQGLARVAVTPHSIAAHAPPIGIPAATSTTNTSNSSTHAPVNIQTTVNINGVKDASEVKDHIQRHVDNAWRHAAASTGAEVR